MKALVTGGAGFLGKAIVPFLASKGYAVEVVDPAESPFALDGVTYHRMDMRAMEPQRFDLIVHLAAVVEGRAMIEGSPLVVGENLALDAFMFRYAEQTQVGRLIYPSSSAAYPIALQRAQGFVLAETDLDFDAMSRPDLTYGWAKLTGEFLASVTRMDVLIYRPFSVYGPEQALTYPVPAIVARAVARENPLELWSDSTRDLVWIGDFMGAFAATFERAPAGALNIATGVATSFAQVARYAAEAVGYEPEIRVVAGKPLGVGWRVGSPTKMNAFYQPRVSAKEGIWQMVRRSPVTPGL